jgi:hypothetical protein
MARLDKPDPIIHVHPMKLQPADLLADERSEWEVIGRPFATAAGNTVHVRVRRVRDPALTELWTWAAHERVTVQRVA